MENFGSLRSLGTKNLGKVVVWGYRAAQFLEEKEFLPRPCPPHSAQKYSTGRTYIFRELTSTRLDRKVILKELLRA